MLLGTVFTAAAQNGTVRGKVIDDANGEELYGVTVVVAGTTTGSITDFEGAFEISLAPGTYDLQFSFVSFKTITISGVEILSGEVTNFNTIRMKEAVEELAEVVVTAEVIRDSEAALYTIKKKSANVLDGISAQNFRKIGDSNAASAMKRVTGVSVEGGKYVYVRGLGDRYTKTMLNGMDIPGLDPDRNTIQMDIFPTNIINNIVVLKSFTADLPADATGGIVNIETKDFPDERTWKLSGGLGFNPAMHFNSDYVTYEGSSTDWLGFDNGDREIPTADNPTYIPFQTDALRNQTDAARYRQILEGFNPNLATMRDNSFMDFSIGTSFGNQISLAKGKLGYFASISYKNETEFLEDAVYSRYGRANSFDENELELRELSRGDVGTNNVLIGALGGIAFKTDRSKYKLSILRLQNGESKAALFDYSGSDQGSNFEAIQNNLEYSQRSMTNLLLSGVHSNQSGTMEFEWRVSPTISTIEDPDIRFTRVRVNDDGDFSVGTEVGLPERIWRNLEERNIASTASAKYDYFMVGRDASFKFGGGHTYKQRDYNIENFQIATNSTDITGNPDDIMSVDNLWSLTNGNGVTYTPLFIPNNPNKYDANVNNTSVFASNEMYVSNNFKTVLGLRMERYTQNYTGVNQENEVFNNVQVIDDLDLFPTANLIYSLNENQNLRASYARTIARPSFKEASYANIIDPLTGRTFIGGFFEDKNDQTGDVFWDGNLRSSRVNNYDLRWEMFMPGGQTLSASVFYKTLQNPIEIVQYTTAANNFQPRNVGDGSVLGLEIEFRKHLDFLGESFEEFMFVSNFTLADSEIQMSDTELKSRQDNARTGETIKSTRDMAGQAPYIINTGISYEGFENGLEAGIYYNVQGETLTFVGAADRPDIYSVPFHSVNFNANKSFGTDNRMKIGIKVSNILNDKKEQIFRSYQAATQFFTQERPATAISVRFGYKF